MAFLRVPTKTVLREVEILNEAFYTNSELRAMVNSEEFYSWSPLGYYKKVHIGKVNDMDSRCSYNNNTGV